MNNLRKLKWENTLMAYEEDIKSRGFRDWIKAHTSFMRPLHRYKGVLELDEQKMIFTGKDVKVDKNFNLEIATGDITDKLYCACLKYHLICPASSSR